MLAAMKGGGASWTPADLPDVVLWLRSTEGITIATGVSLWEDQSGNGNDVKQTTPSLQPTVEASAINGLPVITFDGTGDRLKATAFTLSQPTTVLVVLRQNTWTLNDYFFDGNANASMALTQRVSTPRLGLAAGGAAVAINSDLAVGSFGLVTCKFNGASSSLQVNNNTSVTGNPGAEAPGGFTLGSPGATSSFAGAVSIAEVVLMSSIATDEDLALMRAYVTSRYGISM